jgi:hypothetical protein
MWIGQAGMIVDTYMSQGTQFYGHTYINGATDFVSKEIGFTSHTNFLFAIDMYALCARVQTLDTDMKLSSWNASIDLDYQINNRDHCLGIHYCIGTQLRRLELLRY